MFQEIEIVGLNIFLLTYYTKLVLNKRGANGITKTVNLKTKSDQQC